MEELQIVWLPPGDLIPYSKNAKKHDSRQISNVANSIRRFGWKQPIVIDDNNVVVIGHCRLLAAKKLGQKRVPCIYASGLTDDEIRELRIADNKTNESDWDFILLSEEMETLKFEGFDFVFGDDIPASRDDETKKAKQPEPEINQLPPSKVYIFAISAFGTNSECLLEIPLEQETADKILDRTTNDGVTVFVDALRGAINGV